LSTNANDDASSATTTTSDHFFVGNNHAQQVHTNSFPEYDPRTSYHGYDLSRDISAYNFDANNKLDSEFSSVKICRSGNKWYFILT